MPVDLQERWPRRGVFLNGVSYGFKFGPTASCGGNARQIRKVGVRQTVLSMFRTIFNEEPLQGFRPIIQTMLQHDYAREIEVMIKTNPRSLLQ